MEINQAMLTCHKNGIKVYPIPNTRLGTQIEVKKNEEEPIRYKKRLNSHEDVNEAVKKTYIHFATKITKQSNK